MLVIYLNIYSMRG